MHFLILFIPFGHTVKFQPITKCPWIIRSMLDFKYFNSICKCGFNTITGALCAWRLIASTIISALGEGPNFFWCKDRFLPPFFFKGHQVFYLRGPCVGVTLGYMYTLISFPSYREKPVDLMVLANQGLEKWFLYLTNPFQSTTISP